MVVVAVVVDVFVVDDLVDVVVVVVIVIVVVALVLVIVIISGCFVVLCFDECTLSGEMTGFWSRLPVVVVVEEEDV